MPYSYVLPVAYEINTSSLAQKDIHQNFLSYLGKADNGKDVAKRCEIMCNAVDIAYDKLSAHDGGRNAETLKVFMAPEFYFRGKEGAYPLDVVSKIMPLLRAHTKDAKKFADWLFVFGTALGRIETSDGKFEILNVALVQKGGIAKPDATNERVIYKEYISSIDFAGPNYNKHDDWENPVNRRVHVGGTTKTIVPVEGSRDPLEPSPADQTPGIEYSAAGIKGTLEGRCVFEQDGVCIGLEVCRDHLLGRLRMAPPAAGNAIVQLHLITSAGAYIVPAFVSGRTGTVAFNVDGNSQSDLKVKVGSGCNDSIGAANTYDISLKGTAWWTVTHDAYFGEYGRIKVYPKQPLPDAATA